MNQLVVQILGWAFAAGVVAWLGWELYTAPTVNDENGPFRRKGKIKEDEEDMQE